MSTSALPFKAPRLVVQKVSRLRFLVRLYVLLEALAAAAVVLGAAYWLGLAVDWLLEPSPAWRLALWGVTSAALAAVLWRTLGRRIWAPLRSDSLALLVERRFPELGEALITTVQAAEGGEAAAARRELLEATARRAEDQLTHVGLLQVFSYRPLATKALLAAALAAAIVAFAWRAPDAFAFYNARLRLTDELWPRRVELSIVGFERARGGVINVARNDEYQLEALASIVDGHEAPAVVEVRWRRPSDGGRGGGTMLRIGEARPGRDQAQRYAFAFKVTGDLEFDVIGGDDRIRNLRLHAVERPEPTRIALDVDYPAYMRRAPRTIPASNRVELPAGASAVCRVETNKPLERVDVHEVVGQTDVDATVAGPARRGFRFELAAAASDRTYLIALHDADGVTNAEPFRLAVRSTPDSPPEATVELRGVGTAVTPQARVPAAGKIVDDYGLAEAWFEYSVDSGEPGRQPLRASADDLSELRVAEAFDLTATAEAAGRPRLELKPGQRLALAVKAQDRYDLDEAPHVGSSARFRLDVVTPSELRSLLERRELGLRERFQAIYEKMQGVEDLLQRIDLALPENRADDGASDDAAGATGASRELARLAGSRQSVTQLAFETLGVAEGFEDILAELVNNRVDTEELHERLDEGIATPLREIGGNGLPGLEEQLAAAEASRSVGNAQAVEHLAAARAEAAAISAAMRTVLDRMLELESYNELVELLRGIVGEHQRLRDRTLEEQKQKLRSLLEE